MKLEKAIEIIRDIPDRWGLRIDPDATAALQLGIKALERTQDIRHTVYTDFQSLLPGETDD